MILYNIVLDTLNAVAAGKALLPVEELQKMALEQPPALDFASALKGDDVKLIAEVKKASPSRGVIRQDFNPVEIAGIYADNGASAISVLTEEKYFQGRLDYLRDIRKAVGSKLPLLRKDFIVDEYQVYESRAYGADAILLIAAILKPETLAGLLKLAEGLGLSCLVEIHNEPELEGALKSGARIIGINNRDLTTFATDLSTTERLRPLIPASHVVVSESGIKHRSDIEKMKRIGVDAVLIGETLMSAPDIAARMKELL